MKQKTSGLHVGKYRKQPNIFKADLDRNHPPVSADLLRPRGPAYSLSPGLTSHPAALRLRPDFSCPVHDGAKHFRKEAILLPAALVILIIIVCFARSLLLNGFAALWNETRDLWAAEKGILLPLAETDGSGLWLASVLCSVCCWPRSALASFQSSDVGLNAAHRPHRRGRLHSYLGVAFRVGGNCAFAAGVAEKYRFRSQLSLARRSCAGNCRISCFTLGTMQNLSQTAKDALHHWRYEKTEILPEGDLTKPVPSADGTEAILSVTSDKTDTLYLRGFVGDTYKNGTWSALDAGNRRSGKRSVLLAARKRLLPAISVCTFCYTNRRIRNRNHSNLKSFRLFALSI